jgi:hypothetical protein
MRMGLQHKRYGAFQLSLGFIITVVFSIVLLSLALTWLRSVMGGISSLTDDLTQQAQTNLRETFRQTTNNFAIWPNQYDLKRGTELRLSAGIENDAADGEPHLYVINVIPAAVSDNVCPGGHLEKCPEVVENMKRWLTFFRSVKMVNPNYIDYIPITVRPDENAKKGIYMFHVACCYDKDGIPPVSEKCMPDSENLWGGSASTLLISVN